LRNGQHSVPDFPGIRGGAGTKPKTGQVSKSLTSSCTKDKGRRNQGLSAVHVKKTGNVHALCRGTIERGGGCSSAGVYQRGKRHYHEGNEGKSGIIGGGGD